MFCHRIYAGIRSYLLQISNVKHFYLGFLIERSLLVDTAVTSSFSSSLETELKALAALEDTGGGLGEAAESELLFFRKKRVRSILAN